MQVLIIWKFQASPVLISFLPDGFVQDASDRESTSLLNEGDVSAFAAEVESMKPSPRQDHLRPLFQTALTPDKQVVGVVIVVALH